MEFYEAIEKRRTTRQFLKKEANFEAIKRILEAGNRAPTWNHNRNWQYIILRTDEEKDYAFAEAKKIAEKFDAERYLNMPRPYPVTAGQKMYGYAMPRQFSIHARRQRVLATAGRGNARICKKHRAGICNQRRHYAPPVRYSARHRKLFLPQPN